MNRTDLLVQTESKPNRTESKIVTDNFRCQIEPTVKAFGPNWRKPNRRKPETHAFNSTSNVYAVIYVTDELKLKLSLYRSVEVLHLKFTLIFYRNASCFPTGTVLFIGIKPPNVLHPILSRQMTSLMVDPWLPQQIDYLGRPDLSLEPSFQPLAKSIKKRFTLNLTETIRFLYTP